jgi:hypothetical protein
MRHTRLDRLEIEAGCELPELSDPTPAERARRLVDCDDPPRGDDLDYCRAVAEGRQQDDEPA